MTRSYHHRCFRDRFSHYLCTLHLMAPLIRYSLRTRSRLMRCLLRSFLRGYDTLYRAIFVTT